MQITSFKKQQDHFKRMAVDPANHVFRADGEVVPMTPAIRTKIVEKFTHVAEALQDVQNFGGKQATAILKSIQNVIAVHKLEEIKAIFELVKNKAIERRLFLDTVKMAGTNPAIMFFKEMIMTNKLHIVEMAEVLMTLPHNIKVPNVHIIEHIFELIKHPNVVAHKMLKHNAHIAFATIPKQSSQCMCLARCAPRTSPRSSPSTSLTSRLNWLPPTMMRCMLLSWPLEQSAMTESSPFSSPTLRARLHATLVTGRWLSMPWQRWPTSTGRPSFPYTRPSSSTKARTGS